jgi:uncharacterized Zn finger protein
MDSALRVRVGDFEVTLPESGPATASCSCPAAGVCQHILSAVLFLQKEAPGTISEACRAMQATLKPQHLQARS